MNLLSNFKLKLFLLILLVISVSSCRKIKSPQAVDGILDLSNWDFQKNGSVFLRGNWEFYWEKYLNPQDFQMENKPEMSSFYPLPGSIWKEQTFPNGQKLKEYGYATYRLKVLIRDPDTDIVIFIKNMYNPYKIYINGKLTMYKGILNNDLNPVNSKKMIFEKNFHVTKKEIEIIYQVSNDDSFRKVNNNIAITDYSQYISTFFWDKFLNGIMVGIILFMVIYHLIFFFIRNNDYKSLFFSLFCFLMIIRFLTQDNFIRLPFTDSLFQFNLIRISFITYYSMVFLFFMYLSKLFPDEHHKSVVRIYIPIGLVSSISTFIAPLDFLTNYTFIPFIIFTIVSMNYSIFVIIKALLNKKSGALICLLGFLVLCVTVINDIINIQQQFDFTPLVSYGVTFFCFCQSIILLIIFSTSFKKEAHLSKELQLKNEKLVQFDKLKDEFLANTSHELRTPLIGIIGLTESLIEGISGKLPQKAIQDLHMIELSGRRLNHLVNDILDFSKLKNNNIKLNLIPVELSVIVDIVVILLKPLVDTKNIKLKNNTPHLPLVLADENRLQQIFYNLIGNAIKFTEEGFIEINAEPIHIAHSAVNDGNFIKITIQDSGIGIPEEKFNSIFQPFEQADGSILRKFGGTGLGLTITKQLIELHNGTISVESSVGKGTLFTFTLPVTREKVKPVGCYKKLQHQLTAVDHIIEIAEKNLEYKHYSDEVKKTYTILIVDDEPINLQVLENMLSLAHYSVIKALNGEEALRIIDENSEIDLVLLDIMMPKVSGFEVCKKIRENYKLNKLPIILVTAKNQLSDLINGFDLGSNDYITKPYIKEELIARIKNLLEIRESTNELIRTRICTMHALAEITELKDSYTGNHLKRVASYSKLIACELAKDKNLKWYKYITAKYIDDIAESSILHDIGKVAVPDNILFKPGVLTDQEFDIMKNHTVVGSKALDKAIVEMKADYLRMARDIANYHHEKYDGTGYPEHLKGDNIPLSARIVALADVYDALTTDRIYRKKLSHEKAAKVIIEEMGEAHFDPDILKVFIKNAAKFKKISRQYKEKNGYYFL